MEAIVHNDEPTSQDRLKREQYAEALGRLAESCKTPLVIGLYGTWGMGKTSLMKLIEGKLNQTKSLAIWFDPWQHQFDENPVVALAHTMVEKMAEPGWKEEGKKLLSVIATALSAAFMKATTGLKAHEVLELARLYEEERFQVREARVRLKEYFGKLVEKARASGAEPKRLVFFIDDLDRCMPEEALKLLEGLKLYLNLEGCVYFLGVDREALQQSIRHRYKELDIREVDYLDKIIQLPFDIPPIEPENMGAFVESLLPQGLQNCKDVLVAGLGHNPRQVKRFVNTLTLNHHMAASLKISDYQPQVLALLLLIQMSSPPLYRLIATQSGILSKLQKEEKSDEIQALYNDFLATSEPLRRAFELIELPRGIDLGPYIYMSRVITVIKEPEPGRKESVPLGIILRDHRRWSITKGKEGERANLIAANLIGVDLHGADLSGANLAWSDLNGCNLRGANLQGANLNGANLNGADLSQADLLGANVKMAQLRSAITDSTTILPDSSRGPVKL